MHEHCLPGAGTKHEPVERSGLYRELHVTL